uniref:Transposase n=1 Tax=Steinernema glaseri TaxID=37863 RepID=A0A1I7YRP3_9BILA
MGTEYSCPTKVGPRISNIRGTGECRVRVAGLMRVVNDVLLRNFKGGRYVGRRALSQAKNDILERTQ